MYEVFKKLKSKGKTLFITDREAPEGKQKVYFYSFLNSALDV
jgi:hypothetical protein